MSEAERPELLDPSHEVTVEDIRALTGAATPHFALQVRNRVRRLIEPPAEIYVIMIAPSNNPEGFARFCPARRGADP